MAIGNVGEITCDTPLSAILSSEEISEELNSIAPAITNISNRQSAINAAGTSGGLSTAITIDGQYTCLDYGNALSGGYSECEGNFNAVRNQIQALSETQEFNELKALKSALENKISSIQDNIAGLDEEDEDYDDNASQYRRVKASYDYKLLEVESRINKLDPSITGLGSTSSSGHYGPASLVNTGMDNNNIAYGASGNVVDSDMILGLTSSDNRSKWVMSKAKIGINGWLFTQGDKYYNCYNNYFTTKIKGKDGVERTVYVICPSSGHGTGSDDDLKNCSTPILYISEDDSGHKICFDKEGNAISYNTAMNILEISRSSNKNSLGTVSQYENGKTETTTPATPYSPTVRNVESNKSESAWHDSKADANGKKWTLSGTKTFDGSETWQDYDLSDNWKNPHVYSKDNGDAGKINMLITSADGEYTRYYSVEQPDGTYLYYDQWCKPLSEDKVKDLVMKDYS